MTLEIILRDSLVDILRVLLRPSSGRKNSESELGSMYDAGGDSENSAEPIQGIWKCFDVSCKLLAKTRVGLGHCFTSVT